MSEGKPNARIPVLLKRKHSEHQVQKQFKLKAPFDYS
jgi:hypothetical protein